mmetsp:Transcript_37605/g.94552  ORF Transcript_37605/g.94552 Transcript_37605/m.94552 type:complete len:1379 (+) Transcript_37605:84-4220(+)
MAMDSRRSHSTHAEHAGTLSSEMPPAPPSSSAATPSTSAAPSATSVSSSLPSTSSRSVDDEPPHMKRISRGVSLRGDVSRVHQLDAERFDTQVFSLLKEQYLKIFHLFDRTLVSQYQPEIEALLSLLVFRYSIWKSDRTYGHQMMNLRYQSARSPSTLGLSRWQRSLYGLITIGGGWLLKRLNRMTETHWESADEDTRVFLDRLWKCLRIGERVHSVLSIVSLLVFLYDSRYPTLLSRLLSMRLVYAKRTQARFRNFDFLNRQLLWQYFSEFIFFLVTLLGSGNVLGRVKKHIVDAFSQQQQQQQPLPVATLLEAARQLSTQVAGVLGASRKSPERMAALGTEAANQLEAVLRVAHSFDLAGDAARCSAEQLGQALLGLLGTMSALADEPESKAARNELMRHSKAVGEALRRLVQDGRQLVPAQAECQAAQDAVQSALERLEEADFQVMSGMPGQPSQPQRSHGDFARALVAAAAGLGRHGEELVRHGLGDRAADGEQQDGEASAEQQQQQRLPESVSATAAGLPALVTAAVDAAFTTSGDTQQAVLGMAREAVSALQSALQAVSQCAADPHNEERRAELRAAGEQLQAQVSQLSATMQEGVSALALCDDALIKLRSCAHSLETDGGAAAGTAAGASLTYHQCQDQLVAALKEVTLHSAEAARYAPRGDLDRTAGSLGLLASDVERLTELCGRAAQRVRQDHQRQKLVRALAGVAQSSAQLGEQCRELGVDRQNAAKQAKAAATLKEARQQVDVAVGALREAAVAEQRCEQAAEQAAAAVQRLDSAALMLASGERESVPVAAAAAGPSSSSSAASSSSSAASSSLAASSLEEQCARVEKASAAVRKQVDAVRLAVEGGEESALGEAAETLGEAVSEFAAQSRALLWHLPEAEDQQGLLGSAKLVAMSVQSLALSAHQAQGYPERQGTRDAFERASASALDSVAALGAVVERSTGELIRTAREAHEAERGLRTQLDALDASAAAGSAAGSAAGNQKATAEDVIQQLRAVARSTAATAQAAGSSQAELLEGLATLSAASQAAVRDVHGALRLLGEQPKQRQQLAYATRAAGEAVCGFMRAVGEYRGDDQQSRARLSTHSSKVADHLQSVVVAARALPGGENLELEENDLSQMAEKELLLAAQMIEEAAKRLLTLERPVALDPIKLNEHEIASAILSAARAITTNSSFLIQAAIQMQKELVAHGQAGGRGENAYNKDPAWAQGLISAAQAVAGTTEDLVTYANDAARGEAGDEMVIAAVQQVGAAVTRLVTASRVKADPNSPSLRKLEQASKAVTTSTQHLMSAATRAMKGGAAGGAAAPSAADKASAVKARSSRIAEIERRAQIIKLQRQLEEAQREVTRANKAKYSGAGAASAGPSAKQ